MPHPFSDLRQARTAISISVTPIRRCSTSTWRAARGKVPAADRGYRCHHDAGRSSRRRSTRTSPGLEYPWETPVRRQSEHLRALSARRWKNWPGSGLIYPAFESRAEIARLVAQREAAKRRGRAIPTGRRSIRAPRSRCAPDAARPVDRTGPPYALRLDMAAALALVPDLTWTELWRGPWWRKRRSSPHGRRPGATSSWRARRRRRSYHLSVVIDDALQGVTEVVRGRDLFWSTSVHLLLQSLLWYSATGLSASPAGPRRRRDKSSRSRRKATALRELRRQGATPSDIRLLVGMP